MGQHYLIAMVDTQRAKARLLDRLTQGNTGWAEWHQLTELVQSFEFSEFSDEFLGRFIVSGGRLVFAERSSVAWPAWLPSYVPALVGLKVGDYQYSGGFAGCFDARPSEPGAAFSMAGCDKEMGFPPIEIPAGIYPFQTNLSGALFHISESLQILCPDADTASFRILDSLEHFTRTCISQARLGKDWFKAYRDSVGTILD